MTLKDILSALAARAMMESDSEVQVCLIDALVDVVRAIGIKNGVDPEQVDREIKEVIERVGNRHYSH